MMTCSGGQRKQAGCHSTVLTDLIREDKLMLVSNGDLKAACNPRVQHSRIEPSAKVCEGMSANALDKDEQRHGGVAHQIDGYVKGVGTLQGRCPRNERSGTPDRSIERLLEPTTDLVVFYFPLTPNSFGSFP